MKRSAGSRWVVGLLAGALWVGVPGVRPAMAQGAGAPAAPAAPAGAQGAGPTSATDQEAARLYAEGITAAEAGDWEKSRQLLEKAFRLKKFWKIAANLGKAEAELKKHRDAAEHLEYFLLNAPQDALSPDDRARAQEMLKASQKEVVRLTIMVDVQGTDVLVDGKPVGASPLGVPVYVEPPEKGELHIEARKKGYRSEKKVVKAGKGASQTVTFELKEGGVRDSGGRSSRVLSSGMDNVDEVAPAGKYDSGKGGGNWRPWVIGIGAGLAGVGLGIGIGFTVASNQKDSASDSELEGLKKHTPVGVHVCSNQNPSEHEVGCKRMGDFNSSRDAFRNIAIAGYALGGVAAITAIAVASMSSASTQSVTTAQIKVRIAPALGFGQVGLMADGLF